MFKVNLATNERNSFGLILVQFRIRKGNRNRAEAKTVNTKPTITLPFTRLKFVINSYYSWMSGVARVRTHTHTRMHADYSAMRSTIRPVPRSQIMNFKGQTAGQVARELHAQIL